ncbi:MAG: hypothetical protein II200_07670 [Bacteroidaceae bacterium]|nr:hypothetical protein [Bacteroidaceae bacterium]
MYKFKYLLCFITAMSLACSKMSAQQRVIDAVDSVAVVAATVFSDAGKLIGLTNEQGELPIAKKSDFPLTIRCIGYEATEVATPQTATIFLTPQCFELGEAIITPAEPEVLQLTCYARSFETIYSDTFQLENKYSEHMVNFFVPVATGKRAKKAKKAADGRPRIIAERTWTIRNVNGCDTLIKNEPNEPISMILEQLSQETDTIPQRLLKSTEEQATHSVKGKTGPKIVYSKTDDNLTVAHYPLAETKKGVISLPKAITFILGFDIDITQFYITRSYNMNSTQAPTIKDLVSFATAIDATISGRLIRFAYDRKEVKMSLHTEFYVVKTEYISAETAKDRANLRLAAPKFEIPASAPKLDAATQELIRKVDGK